MTPSTRPSRTLALLVVALTVAGCIAPSRRDLPPSRRDVPPDRRTGAAGISAVDPRTCVSRPAIGGRPGTICDQRGP